MLERITKRILRPAKQNNTLQATRKKIILQAVIAIQAIIIAVVLVFGMSAAWYTNVLQTSGLQFEAEAWGFNGEILIADEPIQASPGQTGVIGLSATNDSDDMIDIAVRVSKGQMVNEMQQRLFFYVDTVVTRNDETLDRAYINSRDCYTYTILSQSQLHLTEEQANDVLLKWQWVYDMEGYYFLGDVTTQTSETGEQSTLVHVEDYLRPVEYNLDKATFEDGMLATVDEKPLKVFLEELSNKDGYKNDITATDMPGYYKVDVDESGYGVWVYLCNWAEIYQATTYDSQLGKAAAEAMENNNEASRYMARLIVVGQMTRSEYIDANNQEQLGTLLNKETMVRLQNDIALTEPLKVYSGENVVLDLNGHSLQAPAGQTALELTDASKLILLNGKLQGDKMAKYVVTVTGSMLTLSGVDITGETSYGINISDEGGTIDSCVRLFDCQVNVSTAAVSVRGNGEESEGVTQLIVEKCELSSQYIAVLGNGTRKYWGTDIQIVDSRLTGYYAALYQPQADSMTRVTNSTLIGGTGVVLKGGNLKITDCLIQAVFTDNETQEPAYNNSGFSDTGDALYVDCSYDMPMNVHIEGSSVFKVAATNGKSIRVFLTEDNTSATSISVTGGLFDSSVIDYVAPGYYYNELNQTVMLKPVEEGESNAE